MFGWYLWTRIMPFEANIYSNLVPDRAIRLWYLSRVPCARVLCCAVRLDGKYCSKIDSFRSMIVYKSFTLLNTLIQHNAAYLLHNLSRIISKMVMNFGQNKPQYHGFCYISVL